MDIKPEIQKTVKRLVSQKNNDVLKNKLRSWLVTREISPNDLIRFCREKVISIPAVVLNKLGTLYGAGKEGLVEDSDTAFLFYLAAADFGFGPANGNVAQYYFDGRAPGGRHMELSFQYCRRALELGTDKFMLMSEILHEREDFPETVRYLRKIIESRSADNRRRAEARKLEIECLQKQLVKTFAKLTAGDEAGALHHFGSATSVGGNSKPLRPHRLALSINANAPPVTTLNPPKSPMSETMDATLRKLASVPYLPSPIPLRATTPRTHHHVSPAHQQSNHATAHTAAQFLTFNHRLPGWFYITDDLEGFDHNACAELTARAEIIELEAEAIKSAYETAENHVLHAKKHKFSEEIINLLVRSKLQEFQEIYRALEENKEQLLETWNAYIDTTEHTLRRQVLAEKKFFAPHRATNPLCLHLAQELFTRRLYQHSAYLDADWSPFFKPSDFLNEPLLLLHHSPYPYRVASARTLITAERSILETVLHTYGRSNSYCYSQQTGFTGKLNLHVYDPTRKDAPVDRDKEKEKDHKESKESKDSDNNGNNPQTSSSSTANAMAKHEPHHPTHHPTQHHVTHPGHHHHSMSHLRAHLREQLISETTYLETVVIGDCVLRYTHRTHPILGVHHLLTPQQLHEWDHEQQLLLHQEQQQQMLLQQQQSLSGASVHHHPLNPALNEATQQAHRHYYHSVSDGNAAQGSTSNQPTSRHGHHHKAQSHLTPSEQLLRNALSQQVRGDDYYYMEDLGHSDDILRFIHRLCSADEDTADNERKLAEILLRFAHDGTPIDAKELALINEDLTDKDAVYLTKIAYHYFVKRLVPWILSCPPETGYVSKYELPMATATARAMTLVRQGLLSFAELFAWDGDYGVFHCGVHRETIAQPPSSSSAAAAAAALLDHPVASSSSGATGGVRSRHTSPLRGTTTTNAANHSGDHNPTHNSSHQTSGSTTTHGHNAVPPLVPPPPPVPSSSATITITHRHSYGQLRRQIANINALYQRGVLEVQPQNFVPTMQFWKRHRHRRSTNINHGGRSGGGNGYGQAPVGGVSTGGSTMILESGTSGVTLPTHKRCRRELQECYGGEIDSDDEDQEDGDEAEDRVNTTVGGEESHHHNHSSISVRAKSGLANSTINHAGSVDDSQYGADDRALDALLSKLRL